MEVQPMKPIGIDPAETSTATTEEKESLSWFERKVAELKAEVQKLPLERQRLLRKRLISESEKAESKNVSL
jgi:hypothetical protein